jgi:hypothetical protein
MPNKTTVERDVLADIAGFFRRGLGPYNAIAKELVYASQSFSDGDVLGVLQIFRDAARHIEEQVTTKVGGE